MYSWEATTCSKKLGVGAYNTVLSRARKSTGSFARKKGCRVGSFFCCRDILYRCFILVPYVWSKSAPREVRAFLLPSAGNVLIRNKVFRCSHSLDGRYCFLREQKLHLMPCSGSRAAAKRFTFASRRVLNNYSSHQLGMNQKPWCIEDWCAPWLAKAKLRYLRGQDSDKAKRNWEI